MNQEIIQKAESWLNSPIDEQTKSEIKQMIDSADQTNLVDSFYKNLEFGTGGLRGIMGAGSNRMNKYTIGMATQGFANYLLKSFEGNEISVAIAHDSRNNSRYFAETTAAVFSANGIKTYLFEDLRPTPELSFAIRELKCQGGVVLTASHNPKEYNGYKAYWNDGAQLIAPHDGNVIDEVNKIKGIEDVKFEKNDSLIEEIGQELDEKYLSCIQDICLSPDSVENQSDLNIVFSSIHGTGITLVPPILEKLGFTNVNVVKEQAEPNGNFPTVVYPNPEESEAMSMALQMAADSKADIIMATDPDSDRVGIGVQNSKGEYQLLNGNQTGALIVNYLLSKWKENDKLTGKEYVVKTIVTTELIGDIAEKYQVKQYDTLTGFKYIAALIGQLEGKETFIGGGEESYGYLISDFVRDKDAIASCAIIAEMTAYYKDQGKSLFDVLTEIYLEHGQYLEGLVSITKKGKSGADEIKEMMKNLRNNPPAILAGSKVTRLLDYNNLEEKNIITGESKKIEQPTSNVLQFFTEDGNKISARPSGTEPKIKFYFSVKGKLDKKENYFDNIVNLENKIQQIRIDLLNE
ncbi:MAG: phospho-sugar mutase [Bacteroidota bacterium]